MWYDTYYEREVQGVMIVFNLKFKGWVRAGMMAGGLVKERSMGKVFGSYEELKQGQHG